MGFVFNRIDSRFVHGQVGARIVRQFNVNRILLIDDKIAADEFMCMVFKVASVNATVDIYTVDQAIAKYKEGDFESKNCMLLFGSVDSAYRAYQGIKYKELDVGSIKGDDRPNTKVITNMICITEEEGAKLKEMKADGCKVYFQSVPDTPVVSLEEGFRNAGFNL